MLARNLAAFTEAMGVENAPIIMSLAMAAWPNDEVRNQFIKEFTGVDIKEANTYG